MSARALMRGLIGVALAFVAIALGVALAPVWAFTERAR